MVQGIGMTFNVAGVAPRARQKFRLLVAGDFSNGGGAAYARPRAVTRDGFADLLGALGETLTLDVPNHLARLPKQLTVTIPLADLSDVSPAGIIAHVPELTTIYLFTQRLHLFLKQELGRAEFLDGLSAYESLPALDGAIRRCRDALAGAPPATRPPPTSGADDATQRILDLVAGAAEAPPAPKRTGMDAVFANLSGAAPADTSAQRAITETVLEVTNLLNAQIGAVLQHPALRRTEAAWRSLRFLLNHARDDSVEVLLLDTPRDALDRNLAHALDDVAPGVALADFDFSTTPADTTLLQRLGELAQDAQTPLLFSVAPDFFGERPARGQALPYLGTLLDQPRYAGWNALRDKECARWLCGAFNRFMLREPYTPDNCRGLDFTENVDGGDGPLWGRPAWLVATLIARSVALTHWPTQITGMQYGAIDRLPLHSLATETGAEIRIPLEWNLTVQNAEDLDHAGILPVVCQPNRDTAWILYAPTLRRSAAARSARETELISLPYQLFVARIAATLREQRDVWAGDGDKSSAAQRMHRAMNELLADTGPNHAAHVSIEPDPDHADRSLLELDLHAGRDILNGASVQMTMPI